MPGGTTSTITIFFAGIAAIVNNVPSNNISRSIVFPAASSISYRTATTGEIPLMPHHTFLYVKLSEMTAGANAANNPQEVCKRVPGSLLPTGSTSPSHCKIELRGANVWVLPRVATVSEDDTFRTAIFSFSQFCSNPKDLPSTLTSGEPDPTLVAARFDILGGTLQGCNRKGKSFVAKLSVESTNNVLYIRQAQKTSRIFLEPGAQVTIYNRPDNMTASLTTMPMDPKGHFGWYYQMNQQALGALDILSVPTNPPALSGSAANCILPGADEIQGEGAASSADCSVSNYP